MLDSRDYNPMPEAAVLALFFHKVANKNCMYVYIGAKIRD